jgi:uncharacterized protein (DUF488 family)
MNESGTHTIFTIGHSTRSLEDFIKILQSFNIGYLIDIRRFPGSRRHPDFNKEYLATALPKSGINYVHTEALGGRRKPQPESKNERWQNEAFRGYADYMETAEFREAISALQSTALEQPAAYMCSEALWWQCHRSLVSDYLKAKGWKVMHIMSAGKAEEHPYTSPARIRNGQLYYSDENLFD